MMDKFKEIFADEMIKYEHKEFGHDPTKEEMLKAIGENKAETEFIFNVAERWHDHRLSSDMVGDTNTD